MRLTVTALATEVDAEEYSEQQRAEAEAAEQAACDAAKEQLADSAGVTIEGMPHAEYDAVYRPVGEHAGWFRFESTEGKHLFRNISDEEWCMHDSSTRMTMQKLRLRVWKQRAACCRLGSSSGRSCATGSGKISR